MLSDFVETSSDTPKSIELGDGSTIAELLKVTRFRNEWRYNANQLILVETTRTTFVWPYWKDKTNENEDTVSPCRYDWESKLSIFIVLKICHRRLNHSTVFHTDKQIISFWFFCMTTIPVHRPCLLEHSIVTSITKRSQITALQLISP